MTRPVIRQDQLELGSDYPCLFAGRPFNGLAVEQRDDGRIWSVQEIAGGYEHGYGIDFAENGQPVYVEESFGHMRHGLVAEWDAAGRLASAERYELGYLTQLLVIEAGGRQRLENLGNLRDDIERERGFLRISVPPMTDDLFMLIARFQGRVYKIYREAQQSLGLV